MTEPMLAPTGGRVVYLVTADHILAIIGGVLGGVLTCLALLIRYARHSNAASKGHRP